MRILGAAPLFRGTHGGSNPTVTATKTPDSSGVFFGARADPRPSPRTLAGMSATSDRDAAIARLEQDFGALFARIRVNWREAAATVHPDLQPLGYRVLAALADGTVTSAGEIIDRFQTDKSAVSRQLRQLEELGLVESRPDPVDRRARVLAVTDLARERIAAARSDREARLGARLDAWSADDLELVSALLRDLAR